jgi:hypothetical protein
MKKSNCLLLTLCCITFMPPLLFSQAQGPKYTIKEVTAADFTGTNYPGDPNAEAVVLFDIGKSSFVQTDNRFEVCFERRCRIRIFSEKGFKWGQVEIPYYRHDQINEDIVDLKGTTYNLENGEVKITSLNLAYCYDEITDENWLVRKFAMPDLQNGSIIDFEYKVYSQYNFNLRDWEFQKTIPVIYSEYEVRMIPFYEYTYVCQGINKFDESYSYLDKGFTKQYAITEYNEMVHRMIMKNVPAFKDEDYITSINNYLIKLEFQLSKVHNPDGSWYTVLTTWPELVKEMLKDPDIGGYIDKSKSISGKLFDLEVLKQMPPITRFNQVVDYVKSNYTWNENRGIYATKVPSDLAKEKVGNVADINLFLTGLLRATGLEAYPVLLSTRDHGFIRTDYPMLNMFNYVAVLVIINGKKILTDATEIHAANDRLPVRCLNDKGLILNKDNSDWIDLRFYGMSIAQTMLSIRPDAGSDSYEATISVSASEYEALYDRNHFGEDREKIIDYLSNEQYHVADTSVKVLNFLEPVDPYQMNCRITGETEKVKNNLYVYPFLSEVLTVNPFRQTSRKFPVDFTYPFAKEFTSTIAIPAGYTISSLPDSISVIKDIYEMSYGAEKDENSVIVNFRYAIKKPLIEASDYVSLKQFYNLLISKSGQKIELVPEL